MSRQTGQRLGWSRGNSRPIKSLAFAILFLALVLLALRGGTWAMPGQSPTHQTVPPAGSIAGKVFLDTDGSGEWEPGERGIGGVEVVLDSGASTYLSEANGDYWFPGLAPGSTHTVSVIRPAGFFPTTDEEVVRTMGGSTLPGKEAYFGYQRRTYLPVVLSNYTAPLADLSSSTKAVDKTSASVGETLHYTIELHSTGTKAADVTLSDRIPTSTTLVAGSVEGGTYSDNHVRWSGTLAPGSSHSVDFVVRLDETASGEIVNTARIDDGYHTPFERTASTQVDPVVANGGFETGDFTSWFHLGELAQFVSTDETHEGSYSALLGDPSYDCEGGVPEGTAWMEQTFTVPASFTPTLSFWYRIHTHDHVFWTNGSLGDSFDVCIGATGGGCTDATRILRDNYDNRPDLSPGCDDEQDLGWKQFSLDLTSYRGQTVSLRFETVNRQDGWDNTWTYVDDVKVIGNP
jgi:uncharacterized repeat protein (TIGR01451 family)